MPYALVPYAFGIFTTVKSSLQIRLFMQNEPNFRKSQMNVSYYIRMDYEKWTLGERGKNEPKTNPKRTQNEPKTNPNEPKFKKAKMNVNKVLLKDYENIANCEPCKNEPKTNPIYPCVASGEAGSKPISKAKNMLLRLSITGRL